MLNERAVSYRPVPIDQLSRSGKRGPLFVALDGGITATRFRDHGFEYLLRGPGQKPLVIEPLPNGEVKCRRYHVRNAQTYVVPLTQLCEWLGGRPVPGLPDVDRAKAPARLEPVALPLPRRPTVADISQLTDRLSCVSEAVRPEVTRLLQLAADTECPMALGRAIGLLTTELENSASRAPSVSLSMIEELRLIRGALVRALPEQGFPPNSHLQRVFLSISSVPRPQSGGQRANARLIEVFSVLWAHAATSDDLVKRGVDWVEVQESVGWKELEMRHFLSWHRGHNSSRRVWLAPSTNGAVCMLPEHAQHFVDLGVPFWALP